MAPGLPLVELVTFRVSDKFKSDPAHFKAALDHLEKARGKGMNGQYWGQAVEKPHTLHWIILWESREAHSALQAEPSYDAWVQELLELADGPLQGIHVHLRDHNPTKFFEAPVVEIDPYKTTAEERDASQARVTALCDYLDKTQPAGYLASTWGPSLEDDTRGIFLGAWVSIEEHMKLDLSGDMAEGLMGALSDLQVMHVRFNAHS